jgi:hypothetical protein
MDVINVPREVGVVADRMLLESPLPDAACADAGATLGQVLGLRHLSREL